MKLAEDAVNMLDADILAIHLNPLQESIQPGGDVDARGYAKSISDICNLVDTPVMVKETGAGICAEDAAKLQRAGVDFIDVLVDKNSLNLVDKILEDLGRCHFEPIFVFNGDPDSIFANHSLNLSGVFNDARQKINSLIVALMQG